MSGSLIGTGLVGDGMDRKGFIPARNYVTPAIRFWYRPMGIMAQAVYLEGMNKQQNSEDQKTVSIGMISSRLRKWDMKYPADWKDEEKQGKPVPTNDTDEIRDVLDPYIQSSISAIIAGLCESPLDPEDSEKIRLEAAGKQGATPSEVLKAMAEAESERQGN